MEAATVAGRATAPAHAPRPAPKRVPRDRPQPGRRPRTKPARKAGAHFSTDGYSTLIQRANRDGVLTLAVGQRADLSPEQVSFLTYGRGVDTTRMRVVLGFEPSFTTTETFAEFGARLRPSLFDVKRIARTVGV